MAADQLSLLGLDVEVSAQLPARPRARRMNADQTPTPLPTLAPGEAVVEHRYPQALDFLREHGPVALAVVHVLAVRAVELEGRLVVRASTRDVAEWLGFLSKDGAHRRLRQLRRVGVLESLPPTGPMDPPSYVLHLDGTGVSVTQAKPSR